MILAAAAAVLGGALLAVARAAPLEPDTTLSANDAELDGEPSDASLADELDDDVLERSASGASLDDELGASLDDELGASLDDRPGASLDDRLGASLDDELGASLDNRLGAGFASAGDLFDVGLRHHRPSRWGRLDAVVTWRRTWPRSDTSPRRDELWLLAVWSW